MSSPAQLTPSGLAGKNINQGMSTSPRRVNPRKLESAETEWNWLHSTAMGCASGRQDSNLRPLVPQISPPFPMRGEFDLEGFRREMVGKTTTSRKLERTGIDVPLRNRWQLVRLCHHDLTHTHFRRASGEPPLQSSEPWLSHSGERP
jgi:hypothetical protein